MEEKSKTKKRRMIIITAIVLAIVLLLILVGYFAVNIMFSKVSDSFYQSTVSDVNTTAEETEGPANGSEGDLQLSEFPEEFPEDFPLTKMQLTGEQFKALTDKIAFNDKLSVLNILRTSLEPKEYKELLAMLSNGITKEEIQRAYAILRVGLSGEDKQKILGYYNKYIDLIQ